MTEFKNLADFKRRVTHMTLVRQAWRREGELVDTDFNWLLIDSTHPNPLLGVKRPVAKINSVDIMLTTIKPDGETVLSHLQLGKASEWSFDGATVTRDDGSGLMQYTVEAREA
jgi:hypothetical protein